MSDRPTGVLYVRIPQGLLADLRAFAGAHGMTLSAAAAKAIERGLEGSGDGARRAFIAGHQTVGYLNRGSDDDKAVAATLAAALEGIAPPNFS